LSGRPSINQQSQIRFIQNKFEQRHKQGGKHENIQKKEAGAGCNLKNLVSTFEETEKRMEVNYV
jgi:hypothetical protein